MTRIKITTSLRLTMNNRGDKWYVVNLNYDTCFLGIVIVLPEEVWRRKLEEGYGSSNMLYVLLALLLLSVTLDFFSNSYALRIIRYDEDLKSYLKAKEQTELQNLPKEANH